MTEKTDIRDSDEKVVEIEMERLDKKKCSSQFTLSSDCIRRFCEKYREARIILISSWKNGFISYFKCTDRFFRMGANVALFPAKNSCVGKI